MIFIPIIGSRKKKVEVYLDKEGKEEELVVVFAGRGDDLIDLDTTCVHKALSTRGRIVIRGILRDRAVARVKGLVKMEKEAQKSDGFLEEKVLLIGDKAKVETSPNLEIKADDVRAGHAAATGMLDEEQLFYLRSRGLSEEEATLVLIGGFIDQVAKNPGKKVASGLRKVKAYALG